MKTFYPSCDYTYVDVILFWKLPDNGVEKFVTTTENTITYHNALCLSPQNFA